MKRLVFDTSTEIMYVAVTDGDRLVLEKIVTGSRNHGKLLVPTINQLLVECKLSPNDLGEIVIGYGPGSYTGIRVSTMVGKMLAYSLNINLRVISSLLFLTSGYEGLVSPLIDARNDNYFSCVYWGDEIYEVDKLRSISELEKSDKYQKSQIIILNADTIKVNALEVIQKSVKTTDILLEPNYLRKTEAERNVNNKS